MLCQYLPQLYRVGPLQSYKAAPCGAPVFFRLSRNTNFVGIKNCPVTFLGAFYIKDAISYTYENLIHVDLLLVAYNFQWQIVHDYSGRSNTRWQISCIECTVQDYELIHYFEKFHSKFSLFHASRLQDGHT